MTQDEVFLQAILASPDDDTPRLVHAHPGTRPVESEAREQLLLHRPTEGRRKRLVRALVELFEMRDDHKIERFSVAGALLGAIAALATFYLTSCQDEDEFTAKYRRIREGMTYKDALQLLGPDDRDSRLKWTKVRGPYNACDWRSPDGSRVITVKWYRDGVLVEKRLKRMDGTLISAERFLPRDPPAWWEWESVGLR